ncbi:response regulator [Phormidium tenue FACHB-886]|nr:response regulator [Phormidium tenue FACHB-886]
MLSTDGSLFNLSILNNVQILIVDNDRDSAALYAALLERCGVVVTVAGSIKEALNFLNWFVPDILICEARFLGESVYPLIQEMRAVAQMRNKAIPIFVTSTFSVVGLAKHLAIKVEAYQIKPIDLDQFRNEVWKLMLLPEMSQPLSLQAVGSKAATECKVEGEVVEHIAEKSLV